MNNIQSGDRYRVHLDQRLKTAFQGELHSLLDQALALLQRLSRMPERNAQSLPSGGYRLALGNLKALYMIDPQTQRVTVYWIETKNRGA